MSIFDLRPIAQLRKLHLDTDLARNGEVRTVIFHPPSSDYENAAKELGRILESQCGVTLPVQCDDAQRNWKKEKRHIIALGNMGTSLLLRYMFHRGFFDPAPDSKLHLQTIHDPWGEGRNVVALGGTDLGNVKANFPRLINLLKVPHPGAVVLPPTLDPCPPLSEEMKAKIDQYTEESARRAINYAAYHAGWVCENYSHFPHARLARLYRDCIRRMAEAKYYVHLYLFRESQGWEVIEQNPALSDADRLMITNFFRECVADEKEGIGYLRRLLREKKLIQGNHESQAACGVLVVADFLRRYYPSEAHGKWYQEALSFFEFYRTVGSYLGDNEGMQSASVEDIMNAVWRAEDDPAAHPFLRRALDRFMPNYNNFGMWPAFGDHAAPYRFASTWYLTGAQIYGRPDYLWMCDFIRNATPTAPVKISSQNETEGWWPLSFVARQPDNFAGLQWAEPDETLFSLAGPAWAKENGIGVADCFGRAAFRAGGSPQDDYALLNGVHLSHAYDDQNGILEYSTLGRTFLVSLDCHYGTKPSAHNVVSVSVDGVADANPPLLATRRLWGELPSFAATRTLLYTDGRAASEYVCPGADWERNILWLKNRFFVVFDRVSARKEGFHSAVAFWRMVGDRHDLPNGCEMRQRNEKDDVRFRLLVEGVDGFALGREQDPQATYGFSRHGQQPPPVVRWPYAPLPPPLDNVPHVIHMLKAYKAARLMPGESFTISTCFAASGMQRQNNIECRQIAPNAVRIDLNREPLLAARGAVALAGLDVSAELSIVSARRLYLVAARSLAVNGKRVIETQSPVSLEWDLSGGNCEVLAERATQAVLDGQTMALPAGRSRHRLDSGASEALAAALRELHPPSVLQRTIHMPPVSRRLQVVGQCRLSSAPESMRVGGIGALSDAIIAGQQDGTVEAFRGDALKPLWTYRCGRVVNSIDLGDLDGDGKNEIVLGSDDNCVHALAPNGTLLWKWQPPFDEAKARAAYFWWLWPEPFVKKVAVYQPTQDGRAEIVVGAGMNTFAVDGQGKPLWAFVSGRSHSPCMRAIVFADVNGDGVEEPIGGASDMWYEGSMYAIGPKGEMLHQYQSDGWCSGVRVAMAEDLLGRGKKALIYGTRKGSIVCYPDVSAPTRKWCRMLGDQVDSLAMLRNKDGLKLVAVAGGDTQWVTAFDPKGERLWAVYFDAPITAMTANASQDKLYVACDKGTVYELEPSGRLLRSAASEGRPNIAAAYPPGGIVIGTREGNLYLMR